MDYRDIIETWVKKFFSTMDKIGQLEPGNSSGDAPFGVKIIFDGFGYDEDTDENTDKSQLSFAVFVHKDSLNNPFPPHEGTPWGLVHRPDEEVCFWVWLDSHGRCMQVSEIEDQQTELDLKLMEALIHQIHKRG